MFRTSNLRGQDRFNDLRQGTFALNATLALTPLQLQIIEQTELLSLSEKIELLLIALGHKLTGEIFSQIEYHWNEQLQAELPTDKSVLALENLLANLPFIFAKDTLLKKVKKTGKQQHFTWFQVSVNQAVAHFMSKYPDDLTEFEEGVLYGFPLSAIRAFAGLIEANHDTPDAATYFLAGFSSQAFWEDEHAYYQLWWERLRKLSAVVVDQAEAEFARQHV